MNDNEFIPYGHQSINEDDIAAVTKSLTAEYLTQGPIVGSFEKAIADKVSAKYAIAVNNATAALHVSCLALGVSEGDRVWTSPNTFVASANCARFCGATVDFVDIDPRTYNLCPEQLAKKLIQAEKLGKLPKVVIPVHFAGQSCNMEAIHSLSKQYGFKIIEDASHAIGGQYQGTPIGDGRFSDVCVFSFHPVKIITSAEGGMAVTNNVNIAKRLRNYANQGITKDPQNLIQNPGDWYYEQHTLGFNYRMTEMQAALGLSQLTRLDQFIEKRHQQFKYYEKLLEDLPLVLPYQSEDTHSALHLFPVLLPAGSESARKAIFDILRQAKIGTQVHYIPVHTQPYYQALGFKWGDFPIAEDYYSRTFSLPLFADLTEKQQERVALVLKHALIANQVMSA